MKKILALILTLSVIAGALLTCLSVHAADNEGIGYTPIENLTCKSTENLAQELSAAGEGFNGSYAMKLTMANPASSKRSTIYFQGSSRTTLGNGGNFRIEFKIKKAAGSLGKNAALNDGTSDNGFAVGFNSGSNWMWAGYLNDSDLSLTEYRTCSYEIALEKTNAWYQFAFRFYSGNDGVSLLIDDLKIYQIVDEQETLVEFQNGLEKDCDFDLKQFFTFDNTVDEELVYTPFNEVAYKSSQSSNVTPALSQRGEGVKGSYAMKLVTEASKTATLGFQGGSTSTYTASTEYIIEFKIKKSAGSISGNFAVGMLGTGEQYQSGNVISSDNLSEQYEYYKFSHTTSSSTGVWRYLQFKYTAGAEGVTLLIDDIKIYPKDAPDALVQFHGQSPKMDADCDFDSKVEYKLTDKCGEYSLVNDIILVDEADTDVSAFKTACSAPSIVTVKLLDGETVMEDTALVKTGTVLSATVEGNEATYTIAVKYDVNSNGSFDIADIVKAARINEGAAASATQLVAANAAEDTVTDANILALRMALLAK